MKKIASYAVVGLIVSLALQGCETTQALKQNPKKSAEVRTQIAAEYIRSGDLDAAKRSLDEALQKDDRDATANMMMGVLLQQEGSPNNLVKADRYFKRAISLNSADAQVRNNYGRYLYQIGRYNDAEKQLQIAGSTLGYGQRAMALENLGQTYLHLGNTTNAEQAFLNALRVDQDSSVSMIELAEISYQRQQYNAAAQFYEGYVRVVGSKNQSAQALWVGIRIARANGDNMSMQVLVNQLRALYPDSQEYQRYLQLQYSTEAVWK
ncbi:type IV pilus biogenesis/stability protein PilW [Acinetobacter nectaris]|uniref:type IV pilus biogenesis/stability protein PilW n=1 Tax=Acinetobacter nectaris TaxID=1219382 RepID=UPI001F01E0E3|nr:type IV pilus biogenesis/stability protein PilW [Acinetobacter nectaris]MCF9027578.1 type IV pilus biogenesis/stability protein PilW [Acinetobacter nectaris]